MGYDEEYMKEFKTIKDNPIILDFSGCKYIGEVHKILKDKFGLPDYYGKNWDALWDCLDGLFLGQDSYTVIIKGYMKMKKELREACKPMLDIFDEVHNGTPNICFNLES